MPSRAVVVVARSAFCQQSAAVLRPVDAVFKQTIHQSNRRRAILRLARDFRQFQQTARRHRSRNIVDALLILRLAEVAVGQSVRADMPDEVRRDFLRRVQIFRIAAIKVRQREAVQPPRLPTAPL